MTYTNSTFLVIAMLSVLSNGCAHSVTPDCTPAAVSTSYPDIAKDETTYYLVKKDDTLYAISQLFALDYRQLAQWNQIAPPSYTIAIGQKIRLSDPIWGNKSTQDRAAPARMEPVRQLPKISKPDALEDASTGAETKQKIVAAAATNRMGSQKKAAMSLNNKPNLSYKPLN